MDSGRAVTGKPTRSTNNTTARSIILTAIVSGQRGIILYTYNQVELLYFAVGGFVE